MDVTESSVFKALLSTGYETAATMLRLMASSKELWTAQEMNSLADSLDLVAEVER